MHDRGYPDDEDFEPDAICAEQYAVGHVGKSIAVMMVALWIDGVVDGGRLVAPSCRTCGVTVFRPKKNSGSLFDGSTLRSYGATTASATNAPAASVFATVFVPFASTIVTEAFATRAPA